MGCALDKQKHHYQVLRMFQEVSASKYASHLPVGTIGARHSHNFEAISSWYQIGGCTECDVNLIRSAEEHDISSGPGNSHTLTSEERELANSSIGAYSVRQVSKRTTVKGST